MNELQIFIAALLVSVALLNSIANRLRLPVPIVLVIGGSPLALVADADWTNEDSIERVRDLYEFRRRRFKVRAGKIDDEDGIEDRSMHISG